MARQAKAAVKAFGGIKYSFKKVKDVTLGAIFGEEDLAPSEMVKRLFAFVAKEGLKVAAAKLSSL